MFLGMLSMLPPALVTICMVTALCTNTSICGENKISHVAGQGFRVFCQALDRCGYISQAQKCFE